MNKTLNCVLICLAFGFCSMYAQEEMSAAEEMARKLQNPLATIKALMTDNQVGFNTGNDNGTSYGFQLQPIYAIDFPKAGFTFLPRGVIPIMGLEPGTDVPRVGQPGSIATTRAWGLGDMVLQTFFAPHTESKWKYGFGPQFSLKTRTNEQLAGADWGAGAVVVLVGDITPQLSSAWILGNTWSFDGNFNAMLFQPMLFYNLNSLPGAYFAYNAMINADWKAPSGNTWTVPLGLTFGRTYDMGGGNGLDAMIGPYYNVVRPNGAADWMIRFGISWMFP